MREALFRAAQQGVYFTDEETVGRWQDEELTETVLADSFVPISPARPGPAAERAGDRATPERAAEGWAAGGSPGGWSDGSLIVWPYPRGTMHIIDRANCADHFLRVHPEFHLETESGLAAAPIWPDRPVLLFAPFDAVVRAARLDDDGYLTIAGRRVSALVNELTLAHLVRHGTLTPADRVSAAGYRPIVQPPRTNLLNGAQITLFKARQMRHVADLLPRLAPLGVAAMPYASSADRADAVGAVTALCEAGSGVVVRPFGASQGTGVALVGPLRDPDEARRAAVAAIERLELAVADKYGAGGAYPLTVTPFVESRKIDDAVTDLRMFVVYDPDTGGLRAVPGMVRRAQFPFRAGEPLTPGTALCNVSGAVVDGELPGPRVFPATGAGVLERLGLTPAALARLGLAACTIWAAALAEEAAYRGVEVPFCYGSVDFLIRDDDGRAVPIEMNGANVGAHPTVAVGRLDLFATATTGALDALVPAVRAAAWAA